MSSLGKLHHIDVIPACFAINISLDKLSPIYTASHILIFSTQQISFNISTLGFLPCTICVFGEME